MNAPAPSLSQLFDLGGRVALVTGGARGIGLGIVARLAEAGARVVVVDRDADAANRAVGQVERAGGRAIFVRADAAEPSEARRAVDAAVDAFGRIDVLVNNAGIFPTRPALAVDEALWDQVLDVNLKGAFFFAQAAARRMIDAGVRGSIVNVASIDALHPTGALAHYDASKGGMLMLTRSLALELGKAGIRVNTICPGAIRTPGADEAMAAMSRAAGLPGAQLAEAFVGRIPLGRMGEPADIANAALFLASDAAAYVTGAHLVVDGGFLLS